MSLSASTGAGPVSDGWVMEGSSTTPAGEPHRVVKGFNWVAGTLDTEQMSRQWVPVEKLRRIQVTHGSQPPMYAGGVDTPWHCP
ncbi:hypothetical protein GCM10010508_23400 [Streptomyces naganishii JCM 4654]|uniref:Uncharacterized protein n=1 Tax=Streptomyces naganishii JCM 4654 TaxID=1306179 RepID=A0A919CWC7_9ACTN|nr:hypothetical protein GCM10010508_23400 [Streptomyces naganishii JCM 4654]